MPCEPCVILTVAECSSRSHQSQFVLCEAHHAALLKRPPNFVTLAPTQLRDFEKLHQMPPINSLTVKLKLHCLRIIHIRACKATRSTLKAPQAQSSWRRRMNIVNPINFLGGLGWCDLQINHDRFLSATHEHTAKLFLAAGVDLLVLPKRWHKNKIARTCVGHIIGL